MQQASLASLHILCGFLILIAAALTSQGAVGKDDPAFECAWRKYAFEYAEKLQPLRPLSSFQDIWDALQLTTLCNNTELEFVSTNDRFVSNQQALSIKRNLNGPSKQFFVDPIKGSDSNIGDQDHPFQSIPRALNATRNFQEPNSTIVLRDGTYFLKETIFFGPEDEGLTIERFSEDEVPEINGGILLHTVWKPFQISKDVNIYVADLSGQGISDITGLQIKSPDRTWRAVRARYPNADIETSLFPEGWITQNTEWIPPEPNFNSTVIHIPLPDNYAGMFQDFYLGIGGPCDRYFPPESYWCQPYGRTAGKVYFVQTPAGLHYSPDLLPHTPYTHGIKNGVVNAWRRGHWYNWMWIIDSDNQTQKTLHWTYGGFQGGEGDTSASDWFIENIFDELDAPNEYFFDPEEQLLYYFHNGTGAPPSTFQFLATNLKVLFKVQGSVDSPAKDITFNGLKFTGTASTYLDPHGVPSGGDWALEKIAAVIFHGTEGLIVHNCTFSRLDGNAIFLDGYNRGVIIQHSEFVWIGNNAITAWGYTDDYFDGTGGDQPRFNKILYNLMHELGHYEKQSSCYFQAKSCQNLIQGNICFNIPRAGINFNDGFGGGNEVSENLLFNTCRESSDHGPFNSWDRVPFLTAVRDGITPSVIPADNIIQRNFFVANYGADGGCVDNDDGSSFYQMISNFFVYGGHKSDFDGHSKRSFNNLNAFPQVYGVACGKWMNLPHAGFEEMYHNNTCILPKAGDMYLDFQDSKCNVEDSESVTVIVGENKIFVPQGNAVVNCHKLYTVAQWQALGFDKGTQIFDSIPSNEQVISWARQLLENSN